jgi:amidase
VLAAFAAVRTEAALDEARALAKRVSSGVADLPLAGVPIAVKDVVPVAGEVMRAGSRATDRTPQRIDHPVVSRLRAAGAIVVGTTTMPEAALWLTTDGDRITRNPWQPERSASGSSGGSAAALGAGLIPLAHGTDGLGSIRLPAAACGVLGLKPSRGLIPAELGQNDWYGMAENGPMATTVADLALMLSVMADDPDLARVRPLRRSLRVAVSAKPPVQGVRTNPGVTAALFGAAALLRRNGHHVERDQPVYPQRLSMAGTFRWFAAAADYVDGVADQSLLQTRTVGHASAGRRLRPLVRSEQLTEWHDRFDAFFDSYDLMLTPVAATHPLRAERWSERAWAANVRANVAASGGFSGMWNVAGLPALTFPFGIDTATGTPIGLQLAARHGQESLLLSVAARIEAWRPWPLTAPGWA